MSTPDTAVRASDPEREHVVARLREAVGEGRLTLAEADERIATAYAAVHRADLAPLTLDLPADHAPPAAPQPASRRGRSGHRPPLPAVLAVLLLVAWIASPLPFPWPLLLVALLVARLRARHSARHRPA
ncbi:DUF1707 domain-containing protein [Actinosynnema sp. NPDC047251]|uniref:Putative membrane protein n=1 Tax=Saccharothrix espanaensis (strain ATCC 51144 / DSM 44229 / JCM 9112 / NBRC 15066 / NRRL 15764) TaxID=1179773 RepID=K0JZQ9_SACES|nr:DUF1707 domain-containing protein [Saccharothrix espanaensis]CCH31556.1 putative membrane protein [Saccharothrix espanaensis DSM 44229]